jgi:hypothetical protein
LLVSWFAALCLSANTRADDGLVIEGSFGLEFDHPPVDLLGASLDGSPVPIGLYGIVRGTDTVVDAATLPPVETLGWHYFSPTVLPPRLSDRGMRFFALTTAAGDLGMIAAVLPGPCDELAPFFTDSITRKYELQTDAVPLEAAPPGLFSEVQRWSSRGRHIVLACGLVSYLLYADEKRMKTWHEDLRREGRKRAEAQRLGLIAETTRLLPGDRNRVHGAFGMYFARPVEGHEKLRKETTVSWEGEKLPAPYDEATYEVVLDPQGYPARIAGSFAGVDYERLKAALEARFGAPGKSTPTHVVHKVSGDFISLRKDATGVRLVVIDNETDAALRTRAKDRAAARWQKETRGL